MADGWGRNTWSSGSWGEGVDQTVELGGWGRGVWGQGSWGQSLGIQATGELGSVTVQEGTGVSVTGVQAAASLGNIAVNADGAINALGNAATGEVGTATVVGNAIFSVTGVAGTTALGVAGPVTTSQCFSYRRFSYRHSGQCSNSRGFVPQCEWPTSHSNTGQHYGSTATERRCHRRSRHYSIRRDRRNRLCRS